MTWQIINRPSAFELASSWDWVRHFHLVCIILEDKHIFREKPQKVEGLGKWVSARKEEGACRGTSLDGGALHFFTDTALDPKKVHWLCSECSFHYFVTSSPSLAAKMAQHVQPGPAFAQKGEEFGFEIENGKWKLIWTRGGARLMVAITNSWWVHAGKSKGAVEAMLWRSPPPLVLVLQLNKCTAMHFRCIARWQRNIIAVHCWKLSSLEVPSPARASHSVALLSSCTKCFV